jgi:pantoate--beta-alanine ligase
MAPVVLETVADLRAAIAGWRRAGERIAYVPTMGALHEGHVSLVHLARQRAERVIVSIFVNPTQFAPTEDLSAYPRTFEADRAKLAEAKADAIFFPPAREIYGSGACTTVTLAGPAAMGLEDRFRPTHFAGVATVVAKLLIQALPEFALFGEKDYQQLCVVTRMARDLDIPTEIVPGPTIRAASGLALSSRNAYMSEEERETIAPVLHRTMQAAARQLRAGVAIAPAMAAAERTIEAAGFALDYLELRLAGSLARPETETCVTGQNYRMLVAAKLPKVRLIDNIAV